MNKKILLFMFVMLIFLSIVYSVDYTAIEHFDSNIGNKTISGSTYQLIFEQNVTIGDLRDLMFRGGLQAKRTSPSVGISSLYFRMDINGVTKFDSKFASINGPNDIRVSSSYLLYENAQNIINIKFYAREEGVGNVIIQNFGLHTLTSRGLNSSFINYENNNFNVTGNFLTLSNLYNVTINNVKNGSVYIELHNLINASATTTLYCELRNPQNTTIGKYKRYLSSSSDLGSTGLITLDTVNQTGNITYKLFCNNSNGVFVKQNINALLISMIDSENKTVQSNIGLLNSGTYGVGEHKLISITGRTLKSGNSTEVVSSSSFSSTTGVQTPALKMYFNGDSSALYQRYLSGNTDRATVFMYSNTNSTTTNNYDLNLTVGTGESISIGASYVLFDVAELQNELINVPPQVNITYPATNTTQWYDNKNINITAYDSDDNLDYCNATFSKVFPYEISETFEDQSIGLWEYIGTPFTSNNINNTDCFNGNYCLEINDEVAQNVLSDEYSNIANDYTYSFYMKWYEDSGVETTLYNGRFIFYFDNATNSAFFNEGRNVSEGNFTNGWNRIVITDKRSEGNASIYLNEKYLLWTPTENLSSNWLGFNSNNKVLLIDDIYVCSGIDINCGLENTTTINENFTTTTKINYTDYPFGNYSINVLCYDTDLAFVSDVNFIELSCEENWIPSNGYCDANFTTSLLYTDNNSCGTNFTLPTDNGTSSTCTCNDNGIQMMTFVTPYCSINDSCYLYADTSNLNTTQEQNAFATALVDTVNYTMTYDVSNSQWNLGLTSNISEDVDITISIHTNETFVSCSVSQTAQMRFRESYYVNFSIYKTPLKNGSMEPILFSDEFDYIYLVYAGNLSGSNNLGILRESMVDTQGMLYSFNKMLPGSNLISNKNLLGKPGVDERVYFWGKYIKGKASIKVYEQGYHNVYIVSNKVSSPTFNYLEFFKPVMDDQVSIDNKIIVLNINESSHWDIQANTFELNGVAIYGKIFETIIWLLVFMLVHAGILFIPVIGSKLSLALSIISAPTLLLILSAVWGPFGL